MWVYYRFPELFPHVGPKAVLCTATVYVCVCVCVCERATNVLALSVAQSGKVTSLYNAPTTNKEVIGWL